MFHNLIVLILGIILGYLISYFYYYKSSLIQRTKIINIKYKYKNLLFSLVNEKNIRRKLELKLKNTEKEKSKQYIKLIAAEEKIVYLSNIYQKYENLNKEFEIQLKKNSNQSCELKELSVRLEELKLSYEKKQYILDNNEKKLLFQFENLANKIFEQSITKTKEQNYQSINQLLLPLKEKLDIFYKQVKEGLNQESFDRHILTHEIKNLQKLNKQITQETVNLTRALKGNNKLQGSWGEVILTKALEASGLREGYEFETQISIKQIDGKRLQPDVIIHLPQGKDIVIDSKMSLLAYERYFNSSNDEDNRKLALNDHISSLRSHMKSLNSKNYQQIYNLNSLDYVLMFIPIEPAFIVAIDHHPELISEALSYNIIIVSPTTLFVALKTINNLWNKENQNRNAKSIIDKGTYLYDKLRLFINDINSIGKYIDKLQYKYSLAKNKLFDGNNNIIDKLEELRNLGIKIKQPITITNKNYFDESFIKSSRRDVS